jgi:hypothetical protein
MSSQYQEIFSLTMTKTKFKEQKTAQSRKGLSGAAPNTTLLDSLDRR